jgi:hypothetical protein
MRVTGLRYPEHTAPKLGSPVFTSDKVVSLSPSGAVSTREAGPSVPVVPEPPPVELVLPVVPAVVPVVPLVDPVVEGK